MARCIMSYIKSSLSIRYFGSTTSRGSRTSTCGLGRCSHASALTNRFSASRTDWKYCSIFSRSRPLNRCCIRRVSAATASNTLCPFFNRSTVISFSAELPSTNSFLNTRDGLDSAGISTPERDHEMPALAVVNAREANLVSEPSCSAAT